jgi:gas vesicle protein
MSNQKQPADKYYEKADRMTQQRATYRAGTGIGGGVVGAAIGSLLGRRVGGVCGAVVGAVAGALVGKGTAERVNRTVDSVVDAAKSVAEGVNHAVNDVNSVGNALKDTVEQVKPSVIGVVDALKDTVEQVKPSVVGVAETVAETINLSVNGGGNAVEDTDKEAEPSVVGAAETVTESVYLSVNGLRNTLKDTVEQIQPFVISVEDAAKDTDKEAKLSDNHNSKLYEERLLEVQMANSTQEHPPSNDVNDQVRQRLEHSQQSQNFQELDIEPIECKDIQQKQEEFNCDRNETQHQVKQQRTRIQLGSKTISQFTGIILGLTTLTWIGSILGFTPQQKLLETKPIELTQELPKSNHSIIPTSKPTPTTIADGWIFVGNINKTSASALAGKSLINGSQSINSSVVPSVGSIVTVTVKPGVTLRKNKPQKPNFNPQQQKALAVIKDREKLKIIKVESITASNTTQPVTKVWAQVHKCGSVCQ